MNDWDLLREYLRTRSQPAFAQLVGRHVRWVHATCTRHTGGDTHLAEDVTQAVFLLLSQKAARLKPDTSIAGWLFRTARLTSANAMKMERRRLRRETTAASVAAEASDVTTSAKHESDLLAALDRAMTRLRPHDRDVLVLRFFNDRSVAEAAAEMGVSFEAAKKRFARSLDALRRALADQGAAVPAILVAATSKSSHVVPAGLANWIAGGASPTNVTATAAAIVRRMSVRKMLATAAAVSLAMIAGISATVIASTRPPSPPPPHALGVVVPTTSPATTATTSASAPTIRRLDGHTTWVTAAAVSPDGRFGVSRSANQLLRWDLRSGVAVGKPVTVREQPFGLAVSNAGLIVAVDRPDILVFDRFDVETPRRLTPPDRRVMHWSLALSPDGTQIAAGGADGVIRLIDPSQGDEIRKLIGHAAGMVGVVAFSPDGRTLLSGGWDRTARLWDVATGTELRRLGGHTSAVQMIAFSSDGKLAATAARSMQTPKGSSAADKFVRVFDLTTGEQRSELAVPTNAVHAVSFSPDGSHVAAVVAREMLVWNVSSRKLADQRGVVPDTCVPTGVSFAGDLQDLLVGGDGPQHNGLLFLVP